MYDPSQARKLVLSTKIDLPDLCLHTGTLYHATQVAEPGSQLSSVVKVAWQCTLSYLAKKTTDNIHMPQIKHMLRVFS